MRPTKRTVAIVAVVLGLIVTVPAIFVARVVLFAPTYNVTSIAAGGAHQAPELLARAWALPVARTYEPVAFQTNGSACGPASLGNALRSLGSTATQSSVLEGTGLCWTGRCFGGLTLEDLAVVAQHAGRKATVLRDLDPASFREHIKQSNDPSVRYIVNFHRGPLFGKGGGHHSPIGGYLEAEDQVFVLDVNADYKPWVVSVERLFQAVDTVDPLSGKKRGLLRVE